MIYNVCGLDKIGRSYGAEAIAMADDLQLFNGSVEMKSGRERDARNFTAWAVYKFETYVLDHAAWTLLTVSGSLHTNTNLFRSSQRLRMLACPTLRRIPSGTAKCGFNTS